MEQPYSPQKFSTLIEQNTNTRRQIMNKASKDHQEPFADEEDNLSEYDEFELLERLETLREDMEDLGITTLVELNERIDGLHAKLDDL
jgi:homoaconitase/3-isopropylmalate dehydratase large subunit